MPSDHVRGAADGETGVAIDVGRAGVLQPSSADALPLTHRWARGDDDRASEQQPASPRETTAEARSHAVRATALDTLVIAAPSTPIGDDRHLRSELDAAYALVGPHRKVRNGVVRLTTA
jgi:hypothetical protein